VITSVDDENAKRVARQMSEGGTIELWEIGRSSSSSSPIRLKRGAHDDQISQVPHRRSGANALNYRELVADRAKRSQIIGKIQRPSCVFGPPSFPLEVRCQV